MFDDHHAAGAVFDFDEIADHLIEQGENVSPSELHGCLTGLICAGATGEAAAGLAGVNQALKLDLHGELADLMLRLYDVTLAALQDDDFEFHPILPDENEELSLRVDALAFWCRGFMAGFARVTASAGRGSQGLPGDSAEILKDIALMIEAGVDEDLSEDESEGNFIEIVEYLRFATLNVFMDTQGQLESGGPTAPSVH